jgi:hypothetical protein
MSETGKPPLRDLSPNGPDVEACVREALETLSQKLGHDPVTGRFTSSNTAAGTTLARSEAFWAAVADAKRELLEQVRRDAGLDGDAVEALRGLQEAYCEARLFRQAMYLRLVELGGPITAKGKARALWTAYCAASDRELKLAQTIGIERKQKRVQTPLEALRGVED